MQDIISLGMHQDASLISNKLHGVKIQVINYYHVQCVADTGEIKWEETIKNLVTTEGLNYLLNTAFKGSSGISSWYVGLKNSGTAAASDSAATINVSPHAWTEYEDYDGATRPALTLGTVSSGSVSNSGSVASFTIGSPAADVYGVFVIDDNTKGGASPATVLYGVGDFASAKVVDPNDTLNVTVTLSASSA